MFKATAFEYRFRFILHGLIYMLGFWAPWVYIPFVAQHFALTSDSTLLVLPLSLARVGWLPPFSRTTVAPVTVAPVVSVTVPRMMPA